MGSKRVVKNNTDQGSVGSITFSPYSGAERNAEVGSFLIPIPTSSTTWTTKPTAATGLPKQGCSLAIFNNSAIVGSVTLGSDGTVTSQAPGSVDVNGNAGIPCTPNAWTFIACWNKQWVISSASTILCYIIADDSMVVATSNTNLP